MSLPARDDAAESKRAEEDARWNPHDALRREWAYFQVQVAVREDYLENNLWIDRQTMSEKMSYMSEIVQKANR